MSNLVQLHAAHHAALPAPEQHNAALPAPEQHHRSVFRPHAALVISLDVDQVEDMHTCL